MGRDFRMEKNNSSQNTLTSLPMLSFKLKKLNLKGHTRNVLVTLNNSKFVIDFIPLYRFPY